MNGFEVPERSIATGSGYVVCMMCVHEMTFDVTYNTQLYMVRGLAYMCVYDRPQARGHTLPTSMDSSVFTERPY